MDGADGRAASGAGPADRRRLEATVRGVVQGVGFRFFVIRQASELELDGWVANRRDGGVECVAEGPAGHLDALLAAVEPRTQLVYVCHPNNPTGTANGGDELRSFLDRLPAHVLCVLDQAYFEYIDDPDYVDGVDLFREDRRLLVLRTFSKIFGLAGLRVGYGIGPADVVAATSRVRRAFDVPAPAQAAPAAVATLTAAGTTAAAAAASIPAAAVISADIFVPLPFTVGVLTAADGPQATLTAAQAPTATLTASTQRGGPG